MCVEKLREIMFFKERRHAPARFTGRHPHEPPLLGQMLQQVQRPLIKRFWNIRVVPHFHKRLRVVLGHDLYAVRRLIRRQCLDRLRQRQPDRVTRLLKFGQRLSDAVERNFHGCLNDLTAVDDRAVQIPDGELE